MDETKQPGIEFVKVVLLELNYKWNEKFRLGKPPLSYEIQGNYSPRLSEDGKSLNARLMVRIISKPLTVSLTIAGLFKEGTSPNLTLREFAQLQAPAHLIPFAREVIFNVTARSPIPPLILNPINVKALTNNWSNKPGTAKRNLKNSVPCNARQK
jgi:hypothetical protein